MATAIIGLAFTAMLQLLATGTVANRESTDTTTAINLANCIHERAIRLNYAKLADDLEGEHKPPIDAQKNELDDMTGWSQVVDVSYVDPNRLTIVVPNEQPTSRVMVSIRRHGKEVHRASWIVTTTDAVLDPTSDSE